MFGDKIVLVTGASGGIGAALARRFGRDGAQLVLVARREDRLRALAEELGSAGADQGKSQPGEPDRPRQSEPGRLRPGHPVKIIVADLVEDGACRQVMSEAVAAFGRVDVLVNNAGIGEYGDFAAKDLAATERMMQLNMTALVQLTHLALPGMLSRREGWILNVASAAAFQPTPYMAAYGATKAFVLSFSMGLWEEVRRAGVVVTCMCPGPVKTEFFDRGGFLERKQEFTRLSLEPDRIAEVSYSALAGKNPFRLPGRLNALGALLTRFVPLKTVTKLVGKVLRQK